MDDVLQLHGDYESIKYEGMNTSALLFAHYALDGTEAIGFCLRTCPENFKSDSESAQEVHRHQPSKRPSAQLKALEKIEKMAQEVREGMKPSDEEKEMMKSIVVVNKHQNEKMQHEMLELYDRGIERYKGLKKRSNEDERVLKNLCKKKTKLVEEMFKDSDESDADEANSVN